MKKASLYLRISPLLFLVAFITSCSRQSSSVTTTESNIPEIKVAPKAASHYVMTDSMVRSIFEDSKGNFWFGSDHAGLTRHDGKASTHFSMEDGLSDNQIRTIQEDRDGNIWFTTGNGLSKYDGGKFTTHRSNTALGLEQLFNNTWQKEPNDLWFNGELEGGIYRYDGQNLSVLKFPILDSTHKSFSISGTVTGISSGKNNMLWMANYNGVIGYDGASFTYINDKRFKSTYHVRSIF